MLDEIRLLSLDERVSYGLLYKDIPELTDLCAPTVREALLDHDKVHRINALLGEHLVPVMSTELQPDQLEALRTGIRPANACSKIKLNFSGVLTEEEGRVLTDLFNEGEFTQVGDSTPRPISTWRLSVPPRHAQDLETVHGSWAKTRICILVETHEGVFWVSPDSVQKGTASQNYTVVSSSAGRTHNKTNTPVSADAGKRYGQWRDVLEEMVFRRPELGYVHFMLTHFLQPMDAQLLNTSVKSTALLVTYRGVQYRVVGMTVSGMLLLSKKLDQHVVYDTTYPFVVVAKDASTVWQQRESI